MFTTRRCRRWVFGARDPERVNRRNGYRHQDLDTWVGTLDVAVPKLAEQHDEWVEQRRYVGLELLKQRRTALATATFDDKEQNTAILGSISA